MCEMCANFSYPDLKKLAILSDVLKFILALNIFYEFGINFDLFKQMNVFKALRSSNGNNS